MKEENLTKEELAFAKSLKFKVQYIDKGKLYETNYVIKEYKFFKKRSISLVCERNSIDGKLTLSFWDTPLEYTKLTNIKNIKQLKKYDKIMGRIAKELSKL